MNRLNLLTILFLGFSLSFASCKKDDDQPLPTPQTQTDDNNKQQDPPEPTKLELLTSKGWVVKAAILEEPIEVNGYYITDLLEFFQECQKDDYIKYNIDGTGTTFVRTACDQEEDSDFVWYQNPDDEDEIWVDSDGSTSIYKIIEVTDEHLIMNTTINLDGEKLGIELLFR